MADFIESDRNVCLRPGSGKQYSLQRAVVQLGRTLEWGSRGRGFKSRRPEIMLCPGTQTFSLCAQRSFTPADTPQPSADSMCAGRTGRDRKSVVYGESPGFLGREKSFKT